jgi:membrane protein
MTFRIPAWLSALIGKSKQFSFPGFQKQSVYEVSILFYKRIVGGAITTRASAIAFNFFLATFPAIIFFFTLIAYIPIPDFQEELLMLLQNIMPANAWETIGETITDIIKNQRGGLLSFGFFAALYFSTNGIVSLIEAFNSTSHLPETRSWIGTRFVAFFLVFVLSLLLISAIVLIVFSQVVLDFLADKHIIQSGWTLFLISSGRWITVLLLFFLVISFLFYFAPARRKEFRFISAGSILSTGLAIVTSLGFSFYINNFGNYNKLYGSIGTILVMLVWLYFNSLVLLLGFELNNCVSFLRLKEKIK